MSHWPPALYLSHPRMPWSVDATTMGITPEALLGLPWERALAEMRALEEGAMANPDEGRQVGHYWLRAPELAPTMGQAAAIGETAEEVRSFARDLLAAKVRTPRGQAFTDLVHVGIGGSALGPLLLVDALGQGGLRVHFLDNTDPDGIGRTLAALGDRLHTSLVLVVSKSGGTAETRNAMLLVRQAMFAAGIHSAGHLVAITGEGSKLDQLAAGEGWLRTFPMWDWVGGRTSVTCAVGLLPAELAGIDTERLLAGAADMDRWTREVEPLHNPAALMAGAWYLAGQGRGERAMVLLPYSDRLLVLSRYLQQLVMESLGKEHDLEGRTVEQGLTVYGNKGSTDQHAYVQQLRDGRDDFFVTFVEVLEDGDGSSLEVDEGVNAGDFLQGFLLGTRRALSDKGRPSLVLSLPRVDAYVLGGLIALFERSVGLYASLIGINAYHQPGVEAGKKAAKQILSLSRQLRHEVHRAPGTAPELAARVGAEAVECLHILERLVATGRLARDGDTPLGSYRPHTPRDG